MAKQLIGRESHVLTPYFGRMRDGEHPTLCCFDLEKAFDSIDILFYLRIYSSLVIMENAGPSFITGIQTPEVLLGLIAMQHLCKSPLNFSESQLPALLDEGGDKLFHLASDSEHIIHNIITVYIRILYAIPKGQCNELDFDLC